MADLFLHSLFYDLDSEENGRHLNRLSALFFLVAAFSLPSIAFAQGGPPLTTDDPGTPGDGHWELNIASQWNPNEDGSNLQLPLLDINYGYGAHLQFNLNTSLINAIPNQDRAKTGVSVASLATKWRFIDEQVLGINVSTYPRVSFHHPLASDNPAINAPGTSYLLPIELSKQLGPIGVNPEVGFGWYTQTSSEWVYGLALSYSWAKETEALVEIHGSFKLGSSEQELLYNIGTRYPVTENMSFIAALGRTFKVYRDSLRSWNVYTGLQIRH